MALIYAGDTFANRIILGVRPDYAKSGFETTFCETHKYRRVLWN
jgi:hypothetical protein